jgi:hypothetical protein
MASSIERLAKSQVQRRAFSFGYAEGLRSNARSFEKKTGSAWFSNEATRDGASR